MKKLLLTIALIIFGFTATGQTTIDTTGMSDYEKYYYAKEGMIDTTKNVVQAQIPEEKQVTTIFDRKNKPQKIRTEGYYDGYSDGYEEGVEDVAQLFGDDFSYANRFYRFNYGYGFSYYSSYWRFHYGYYDPFWYDPFYDPFRWDPWYYDRYYYSPYYSYNYYSPYRYDYWYGYNYYPYAHTYIYVDNRTPNRGYGVMGSRSYSYHSPNKNIANSRSIYQKYPTTSAKSSIMNMNTARRTSPSTFSGTKSAFTQDTRTTAKQVPTIINRTGTQTQTRRMETTSASKSTQAYQKPTYNSSQRTYTPSYNQPSKSTRPQYNNTNPQKVQTETYRMNQPTTVKTPSQTRTTTQTQNRTYSAPTQQRTTTQTRTYSAPRTSAPTYSAPSKSTYSTPSRSSGSSYSTPSRSSSSSYSTPSRSSGSSYSGGSSSGSRSTSSSSSSGSMGKSSGGRR